VDDAAGEGGDYTGGGEGGEHEVDQVEVGVGDGLCAGVLFEGRGGGLHCRRGVGDLAYRNLDVAQCISRELRATGGLGLLSAPAGLAAGAEAGIAASSSACGRRRNSPRDLAMSLAVESRPGSRRRMIGWSLMPRRIGRHRLRL
jgi:hypothetical protein